MYYVVYGFLWLLSLMPFWLLYFFSDCIYGLVYYVFKYRRAVVMNNLAIAFPEKTEEERAKIAKQFYHNLIDTFLESVKFITMRKRTIMKRSSGEFDLLNNLIDKGRNVHIMGAHQFNWEYANLLYALNLKVPFAGVYMPIANKNLDRIFYKFRGQYGTILISAPDFRDKRHEVFEKQYLLALAADQNPGNPASGYWMNFFSKPAPFVSGPWKGAVRNNTAIVMVAMNRVKRGHYHFTAELLTDSASAFTEAQLVLQYKKALEKIIHKDPANYLWSHRRWKYDWKPEYGKVIE